MRIAANDVERIIAVSQAEQRATDVWSGGSSSLGELITAFKRAAQLRDIPFRAAIVRGAKSRVPRVVLKTHDTYMANGSVYVRCLVPYTESEELHRRRHRAKYYTRKLVRDGKDVTEVRAFPVLHAHEQYIRADRLEAAR